jgi:uncharacterized protein (DUF433 family)
LNSSAHAGENIAVEDTAHSLLGIGIYTIPEAARITGIHAARIRRWVKGYSYISRGTPYSSLPVFELQLPSIDGVVAMGFLDLIEVRFINGFRDAGVSWPVIRKAYVKAVDLVGTDHPFCTRKFKTDGRTILAEISSETGEKVLLNLMTEQYELEKIIGPQLYRGIVFHDQKIGEWWPLGHERSIVIDPDRMFGQPIIAAVGVPTAILARAYRAERSAEIVARWYEVDERSVMDAVEFERLAA